MNATELFLNTPAADNSPTGLGNLLNTKPVVRQADQKMFRVTFHKALQVDQHGRSQANGIKYADRNANPPIDNANFTQKIKQSDSPERQTVTAAPVKGNAAYRDSSPTSKTPQNTTQNQDQSPSNDKLSSQTDAASESQASLQAAQATDQAQASSVDQKNAKADAATIALDDAAKADAQQMELLLNLLAMLLQMRADGQNTALTADTKVAGDATAPLDGLQLSFTVNKDSELYKQLTQLLNNVDGVSPELRDQMKLLVNISDDKAIQISVSDLLGKAEAQAGQDAGKAALSMDSSPNGDAATFTLKLSADEIAKAQLVDLTAKTAPAQARDAVATRPQIALLVPAELLDAHKAAADAEMQQQPSARTGLESQAVKAGAGTTAADKAAEIVIPLGVTAQMAKPKVATADAKFLESDEYLKRLDVKQLAKALSEGTAPKAELSARFERLFSSAKPGETLNPVLLNGKGAGYEFVKGLFNNFNEQKDMDGGKAQQQADWMKNQLRAELNPDRLTLASRTADITSTDRISFLGRPTEGSSTTSFQQAVEQATQTRAPQQNAEVYQNVMDQITSRIQLSQMSAAGGEMRIFLRPEHLGDIQIKVRVDQDVVVAKFVAHSQEVKAIIESSMNQLKDALAEAGIKAGKIVVTLENNGQNHQPAADSGRQAPNGKSGYQDASAPAAEESLTANAEYLPMNDEVIYGTRTLGAAASRFSYFA